VASYEGVVEVGEVFVGRALIGDDVGEVGRDRGRNGFARWVVVEEEIDFSVGLGELP
jgi:hypothetical protein